MFPENEHEHFRHQTNLSLICIESFKFKFMIHHPMTTFIHTKIQVPLQCHIDVQIAMDKWMFFFCEEIQTIQIGLWGHNYLFDSKDLFCSFDSFIEICLAKISDWTVQFTFLPRAIQEWILCILEYNLFNIKLMLSLLSNASSSQLLTYFI